MGRNYEPDHPIQKLGEHVEHEPDHFHHGPRSDRLRAGGVAEVTPKSAMRWQRSNNMTIDEQINDARLTEAVERIRCTAGLADVLSYIADQSKQFRQCAGHHAAHNRGAEAVAIRAAEILDRIATDIKSANDQAQRPDL